ncbi:MAG: hypothetical protein IT410_01205 [Candidatus Doudnabacteria bacterium]|nr:hypothetical protein [Candidatus Doudnabacteria bacterium]
MSEARQSQNPPEPKYVEVHVEIYKSLAHKGYAFGTAIINGTRKDVFVGKKGHSYQNENGYWEKYREGMQRAPFEGDVVRARVCLRVDPGKSPFAAFWYFLSEASDEGNNEGFSILEEDYEARYLCDDCGMSPCRCAQEY